MADRLGYRVRVTADHLSVEGEAVEQPGWAGELAHALDAWFDAGDLVTARQTAWLLELVLTGQAGAWLEEVTRD